nr:MAG TPA: hypothetical protein [Caudoviricetes sp.]
MNKYRVDYNSELDLYEVKETTKDGCPSVYVSEDREDCMICKEYLDKIESYRMEE